MKTLTTIFVFLFSFTLTLHAQDFTVASGKTLTIAKSGSLTVGGAFSNSGTVTLNSDSNEFAVIIVQGTSSGNITYERHVADEGSNEWDYIGSPVASQDLQTLIDNNSSLATNGSQVAIGAFDNSAGDTAALMYTNYSTTGNSGTTITSGQGFAMATDEGSTTATVDFTGTINTSDVTFAIDDESSSNTNNGKFNLVSNPFPTYIAFNAAAVSASGATEAFLTINATTNDNLHNSYAGLWGYDGDGTFTEKNASSAGAIYIAPGQGFFVAADASTNLSFNEAMQTTSGSDDFISGDTMDDSYEVLLRLYHGDQVIEDARLFFMEELTLGLDIAYDMGDFNYNAALMTRLVEEDEGYGMAINAMSTEDMDDVVIPLEINQTAGQEFKINLHTSTIGEINIYLEDTELQTLTLLNEEDFAMTPTSDLSDAGRFYIHLTADTLSGEEVNTSLLNAYKGVDNNYITIEGLATQTTSTEVSLYNILGTSVMDTTLDNTTNTQMISTNGLSTGIYVLKLVSGQDQLTKKLIIK